MRSRVYGIKCLVKLLISEAEYSFEPGFNGIIYNSDFKEVSFSEKKLVRFANVPIFI